MSEANLEAVPAAEQEVIEESAAEEQVSSKGETPPEIEAPEQSIQNLDFPVDEPPPIVEKTISYSNLEDSEENLHLDDMLRKMSVEEEDLDKFKSEELQSEFASQCLNDEEQSPEKFPVVLFSDDRIHPEPIVTRLLHSPPPELLGVDLVSGDTNEDEEKFDIPFGITMSRTGSLESLPTAPEHLLFNLYDTEKEFPRIESPTEKEPEATPAPQDDVKAEEPTEPVKEETKDATEEKQPEVEVVKIDREELIQLICKDLEVREKLNSRNTTLQNKLADHFKRKRTDDARDGEKSIADQEQRYMGCMASLNELQTESDNVNISNQKIIAEYQSKLEEKVLEVNEKAEQFWKYKLAIAAGSENSRTGKPLAPKIIEQLEAVERKKENEVVAVRLENIKLRNKLKRQEQLLRQKEELADGLHLIDFEQLKIENQTYNEKIEERNEELLKLRKKITNVVQVLTHVKEKLQFVHGEVTGLKQELKVLEDQVTAKRDLLPVMKNTRDKLRSVNTLLRQQNGLLGNDRLLLDYGNNVDNSQILQRQIIELQKEYAKLIDESVIIRRKIQKSHLISQLKKGVAPIAT